MIIVVIIVGLIINWRLGGLFGDAKLNKKDLVNKKEQTESTTGKTETKNEKDKSDDKKKEVKKTGKTIKITIPKGSASQTVCDILLENKLIDDKKEFYTYVTDKKVETKLKYGNYEIPEGSSFDEIIEILTK